jgi:hypothetical protein
MTSIPVRSKFATDAIARYAKATNAKDGGAKFGAAFDKAKQARAATAASTTARPAATTTAASTTARPASKSNLSEAKRAELSATYKKNYAAATAKKPAATTTAASTTARPAATTTAASTTAKPASKSILSDAKRAELSANYKKNYAAAMAPFKDRIATKNAAKAAATVKKATGGYVTKPTFKW